MKSAMLYGLMLGIAVPLLTTMAPQPGGSILLWGAIAVQLSWAAALTRERTGLLFSSLAMALGSALAVMVVAVHAAGYDLFSIPMPWATVFWSGVVVAPITLHVDMFVNPAKWEAWKRHMEEISIWDMLRFRHIPDLRSSKMPGA